MHRLVRRVLIAVAVSVCAVAGGVSLALQHAPLVARGASVSLDDVRRARSLLVRNDPRRGAADAVRTVTLSEQDATLLAQYGASRWRRASARLALRDGSANVQASIEMPANPLGTWLNIDADVRADDGLPTVERLRVGRLPVPAAMAIPLLEWVLARAGTDAPVALARDMVQRTSFTADSVRVVYRWKRDAAGRVRDLLVAPEEVARLEAYHVRLAELLNATAPGAALSVAQLLQPLMADAAQRTGSSDAATENKAAIATLTLYVTGRRIGTWLRQAQAWPALPRRTVTLAGRADLAKHFLVSAVVAAEADGRMADAVGLTKEIDDARGGTGFSFADLAADRAGTRFGEQAVGSPEALQEALAGGLADGALLPDIAGLPESMSEAEFIRRFGGVGAPEYNRMMATIEARVAGLPWVR